MSRLQKRLGKARVSRTPTPMTTDDEYESDTASVASNDSLWGNDPDTVDVKSNWQDEMLETLDALGDRKNSSTTGREELLKSFVRVASLKVVTEEMLAGRADELISLLGRMVKSGRSVKEVTLAARAICLLAASIPDNTSLTTTILPLLQQTISNGKDEGSLPALIYALASVAFSSSTLTSAEILPLMQFLSEIFESSGHSINQGDDDDIITASIEAYAILLSIIESPEDTIPDAMPALVDCLSSASLSVRLSAGEAIALSYELTPLEDSESESPQPEIPPYDDIHHLTTLLSSLSTQSTKKISKHSRREQHSLFRDILRTVADHRGLPTQKLRFAKNQELRINSWEKLLRLKHLRRIFTHGLHVHLAGNTHVREALELAPVIDAGSSSEEEDGMSSVERRSLQKEVKRLRKGKIRQDRRRAGEGRMIDVFGVDEEGEI